MAKLNISFGVLFFTIIVTPLLAQEEQKPVRVGVASVLSGDLQVLGKNIVNTCETYKKHNLRHPIEFVYEDAN